MPAMEEGNEPTCGRPGCRNRHYRRDLCEKHYWFDLRARRARGEFDELDTVAAQRHLRLLRWRGWSWISLEPLTRLSAKRLSGLYDGRESTLQRRYVEAILQIRPVWQHSRLSVPTAGSVRRLSALSWQGWTRQFCAQQIGMSPTTLNHLPARETTTAATAAAVAEFYDQHVHRPGPNLRSARRSRTLGALPAGIWDDDTIDDPDARIDIGLINDWSFLAEVAKRRARDEAYADIAEFLGCTELSLRRVVLAARNKRRYQKKRGSAA